ncbi:MAG: transcription-repair coupling factor [Chloroflexi bacterium RBG_16_52_11]|nr:MAG: transcription-repair coupling factor [Chloroflexi bacterium RBG_16_52_11]
MLDTLVTDILFATQELLSTIEAAKVIPPLGLRRSARLPVLAGLYAGLDRPFLMITDRSDHALTLFDELALWAPEVPRFLFPEPNPLFYELTAWGETTRRERLVVLTNLARYHIPGAAPPTKPPIIIAPARAVMTRTIPRREFLKATYPLHTGDRLQSTETIRRWVCSGYEVVNTVIAQGQFARRGGILDIWPPVEQYPVRLELFGDEIETLRPFDPATQRTIPKRLDHILVSPAREYVLPIDRLEESEAHLPLESSEFELPLIHSQIASILDYLPRQGLVLIDDLQAVRDNIEEVEEQAVGLRRDAIVENNLPKEFPLPYLTWSEIADTLPKKQHLILGQSANPDDLPASSLSEMFNAGPRFGGQLKPFIDHLVSRIEAGEKTVIVSRQSPRLEELWKERAYPPASITDNPPQFIQGSLSEGWTLTLPSASLLHLLTDGEIFGWRRPEPRKRPRLMVETPETAYADLQPGDMVVHVDHGIGLFIGMVNRTIDGVEREYLCIEYMDEAQLYVPVHQADRLTRYIGPDGRTPALSRLGGTEWRTAKGQVKEAVQEVAQDLLELYARRRIVEGYAFSPDTIWQQELEASFPYIDTEDQVRVLAEVKRDMESTQPMDRLICGDVGYGKTEVALRAAFKAVSDGKQVAMLVPTTVLAQQHSTTFQERLSAFPVVVEMLSRFRTQPEQRDVLSRLETGRVDIVIGTHRLLSSDVRFKDLGLLIIDEEQRFGVSHKETLKKIRTEVDVLTLTATPIPRTLYMTLTGVRDISTINTPPEERQPIITHVGPFSTKLVRHAILRELERGGQIFFVHNRVQTIPAMHSHLKMLVPEARITIAHGQMPEHELSERMKLFTNGDVDILLCTSIIESGLDIPNANTLIVDRADTFGLAQLYQLRGRVGRGAQRAYAYFFRHNRKPMTLDGRQRLETIAENTQLGAGFSIAMRDLEIRGAGELLGTRQHGHIAAVGFHLYTRLLAQAVRHLRRDAGFPQVPIAPSLDVEGPYQVNVDLPLPISIPAEYVPDKSMRLRLYRRLADIHSTSEVQALEEEFNDRFGPPPLAVRNLFFQLNAKLLAESAGLGSISNENNQIVLRFTDGSIPPELPYLGPTVRIGKTALWMPYVHLEDWQQELMGVLKKLDSSANYDKL